jgi:hypothetical protein
LLTDSFLANEVLPFELREDGIDLAVVQAVSGDEGGKYLLYAVSMRRPLHQDSEYGVFCTHMDSSASREEYLEIRYIRVRYYCSIRVA